MSFRSIVKHLNRGRLLVIVLGLIAVSWIIFQQLFLRNGACANQMCPVYDYSYLFRLALVITISVVAFWLLKNPKSSS